VIISVSAAAIPLAVMHDNQQKNKNEIYLYSTSSYESKIAFEHHI